MIHGPAKQRDIARSVLPSTQRKTVRQDLATLRRRNRRAIRRDLHVVAQPRGAVAVVEHYDGNPADLWCYPYEDIGWVVYDRRLGDKLGALFRWARARTRDLPLEDRLGAVRRVLGDNLIGRHALSHVERDPYFRAVHEHERAWWFDRPRTDRPGREELVFELRCVAAHALEHGYHVALNRWMKAHPSDEGATRLLGGAHDVEAFADDCARCPAWQQAVGSFRGGAPGLRP